MKYLKYVFLVLTMAVVVFAAGCGTTYDGGNTTGDISDQPGQVGGENTTGALDIGDQEAIPGEETGEITPPEQEMGEVTPPEEGTGVNTTGGQVNPSAGQKTEVSMQNMAFKPDTISVNQGEMVVWTNDDSVAHTVTSDSGTELESPQIQPGETYSHSFEAAGSYAYHCTNHPDVMKGTVIVE